MKGEWIRDRIHVSDLGLFSAEVSMVSNPGVEFRVRTHLAPAAYLATFRGISPLSSKANKLVADNCFAFHFRCRIRCSSGEREHPTGTSGGTCYFRLGD